MNQNTTLLPEDRLNKNNYEEWHFVIENILESNDILDNARTDVMGTLEQQIIEIRRTENPDPNTVRNLERQYLETKKKDAMAKTIICTNVSHEVVGKIKGLTTAFAVMEKIKTLYGRRRSDDVQYLLKKMYSIKAKSIYECKEAVTELLEIFEKLNNLNVNMDELEKIRILYLSFPLILQIMAVPEENQNLDNYLSKVRHIVNFRIYAFNANNGASRNHHNNYEEFMDLDNIVKPNSVDREIAYFSKSKFCHICNTSGHTTEECYYNGLTNKSKDDNKSKDKKQHNNIKSEKKLKPKRKGSNKGSQKKNNSKSLRNIQYDELSETEITLDNLSRDQEINYFEFTNDIQKENYKLNEVQKIYNVSPSNNHLKEQTVWIFDTGASEHLTNNKTILENYQENKVTLK